MKKKDIDHLIDIRTSSPEQLALPVFATKETQKGELAIKNITKRISKLHQTTEFIFRRPNHKKII